MVLCVDEKSQVQALHRSQPAFPMMPGMPERRTHDYVRHGTTTLVRGDERRRRHRDHQPAPASPRDRVQEVPDQDRRRGPRRPRHPPDLRQLRHPQAPDHQDLAWPLTLGCTLHFTPTYSSWLNLVERFFGYVTADLLQRSDHRSVQALEADIRKWVKAWNENPRPFVWTKTADQILGSLGRLMQRISKFGALAENVAHRS